MLVLARSVGQSVVLDDRITVVVLGTRGTLVRLGIEAARDVGVRRERRFRAVDPNDVAGLRIGIAADVGDAAP